MLEKIYQVHPNDVLGKKRHNSEKQKCGISCKLMKVHNCWLKEDSNSNEF
jgi:hypothetical protein